MQYAAGGAEEARAAYSEAYNAMFDLQLDYHSHMQPYRSAADGTAKWAQIELWPMIVRRIYHFELLSFLNWPLPLLTCYAQFDCMSASQLTVLSF